MAAYEKMIRARTALVLEHPFYGSLALRLKLVEASFVETAAVDGVHLYYNPEYVESISMPEIKGLLAHEVVHCANGHPWRRGNREPGRWNEACDYTVNPLLVEAGFQLFPNALNEPAYAGKAAEEVYAALGKQPPSGGEPEAQEEPQAGEEEGENEQDGDGEGEGDEDEAQGEGEGDGEDQDDGADTGDGEGDSDGQGGQGDSDGDGDGGQGDQGSDGPVTPDGRQVPGDTGGYGSVIDAPAPEGKSEPEPSDLIDLEQEWKTAVAQAAQAARVAGKLGGGLEAAIAEELQPKADWRQILREFINVHARSDYSWSRPNRRHIGQGLYLPSVRSEECPPIVIAVDTSGSVSVEMLAQFQGELNSILEEVKPERVVVIYCDSRVTHQQEFEPEDFPVELEARGRGGTMFQPVFDWVAQDAELEQDLACLVYLTDMYPCDAPQDPGYPVLWADYAGGYGPEQSFGERIVIE